MKPISIFADFYGIDNIKGDISIDRLTTEIEHYIEKYDLNGRSRSNKNGYQSNDLDYSIIKKQFKEISLLLDTIEKKCKDFLKNDNIGLSNSWVNINNKNNYNKPHCHPYSILSGTVYINVPSDKDKDNGNFTFIRNREFLDYAIETYTHEFEPLYSGHNKTIHPKTGDIIIFPSYMMHEVDPHQSKEQRISIAFNTRAIF